ncbi:hypothetical protein B0H10DRAFT_1963818 [Mycena sp. CBHHK59/15]|nr:hypothetical protein B0H10DRAFT_1963818 [Mycena sp. CBHHK59/15]
MKAEAFLVPAENHKMITFDTNERGLDVTLSNLEDAYHKARKFNWCHNVATQSCFTVIQSLQKTNGTWLMPVSIHPTGHVWFTFFTGKHSNAFYETGPSMVLLRSTQCDNLQAYLCLFAVEGKATAEADMQSFFEQLNKTWAEAVCSFVLVYELTPYTLASLKIRPLSHLQLRVSVPSGAKDNAKAAGISGASSIKEQYCDTCSRNINLGKGGKGNWMLHVDSLAHLAKDATAEELGKTKPIANYFAPKPAVASTSTLSTTPASSNSVLISAPTPTTLPLALLMSISLWTT